MSELENGKVEKLEGVKWQDFAPSYWHLNIASEDDVIRLGELNLRQLIRYWRSESKSKAEEIVRCQKTLDSFKDVDASIIREQAKNFENPQFPSIGKREGHMEPLDAASMNRKSRTTTFNVCGWCEYASGGLCRYQYHIKTTCQLCRIAGIEATSGSDKFFNTACVWQNATQQDFEDLRQGYIKKIDALVADKKASDDKIRILLGLESRTEKKPYLPESRPYDLYNLDDKVVCYIGNWEEKIIPEDFATGTVVDGHRHHDGCVSIVFDKKVTNNEYLEGRSGGFGMSRPEVMLDWEFAYLLDHPDFAKYWLSQTSGRLEDFDLDKILQAFEKFRAELKKPVVSLEQNK